MSNFEFNYKRSRDNNTLNTPNEINVSVKLEAPPNSEDYKKLLEIRKTLEELAKNYIDPKESAKTKTPEKK